MRFSKYLGHFIFLFHFVFSIIFVYEKTLYSDAANFIFNIINKSDFYIAAGRYACLPPQLFTLAAIKLSMPLQAVFIAYSLSYIVYYYLIYNFVVYVLKNAEVGLVIAFSLLLCIRFNWFMNHCEMHVAIVHCLLLVAFMEYYFRYKTISKVAYIALTSFLLALCFFSHPAILLAVVFVLLYEAADKKELLDYKLYLFGLVCVALAIGKSLLTEQNSYEGNLISQVYHSKELLLNLKDVYSVEYLITRFWSLYFFASIFGVLIVWWYINKRDFLKLIIFTGCVLFFLLVSIIIYHAGDADLLMERAYSMLVVFVMVPVMLDIFPVWPQAIRIKLFLILVVIFSFKNIYKAGQYCQKRFEYMASLVDQQRGKEQRKFLIRKDSLEEDKIWGRWAIGYETLMYSSLTGPSDGITCYVIEDPSVFSYNASDPQLFLGAPFERDWKITELNPRYFALPSQKYEEIK